MKNRNDKSNRRLKRRLNGRLNGNRRQRNRPPVTGSKTKPVGKAPVISKVRIKRLTVQQFNRHWRLIYKDGERRSIGTIRESSERSQLALLFAMLVAAIIPTSLNVRAEGSETASLDPTMQLAKEYIYAGSRMLAIEDYGLSPGSTPTPTPTETPTPTPTETPTPTPTPSPTPTVTPVPVGSSPTGRFDSITVDANQKVTISGWSFDPTDSSRSNLVHIYFDGTLAISTVASRPRPDVNTLQNITGDHGFELIFTNPFSDGNQHSIDVYGLDLNAANPTLLYNSPITLQGGP